jgi:hypothetical protein
MFAGDGDNREMYIWCDVGGDGGGDGPMCVLCSVFDGDAKFIVLNFCLKTINSKFPNNC